MGDLAERNNRHSPQEAIKVSEGNLDSLDHFYRLLLGELRPKVAMKEEQLAFLKTCELGIYSPLAFSIPS